MWPFQEASEIPITENSNFARKARYTETALAETHWNRWNDVTPKLLPCIWVCTFALATVHSMTTLSNIDSWQWVQASWDTRIVWSMPTERAQFRVAQARSWRTRLRRSRSMRQNVVSRKKGSTKKRRLYGRDHKCFRKGFRNLEIHSVPNTEYYSLHIQVEILKKMNAQRKEATIVKSQCTNCPVVCILFVYAKELQAYSRDPTAYTAQQSHRSGRGAFLCCVPFNKRNACT